MKSYVSAALLITTVFFIKGSAEAESAPSPSPSCKSIECPIYDIIHHGKDFQIRRYNRTVWMSTSLIHNISLVDATRTGFLRLFNYIQGKNEEETKIPMTAPVLTDVFSSSGPFCESSFVVSFSVPRDFQNTPPKAEKSLALEERRWGMQYAAVRSFGGFVSDFNVGEEAAKLQASLIGTPWERFISASKMKEGESDTSVYSVAQYDAPFEYEHRVNEIWMLFDLSNSTHAHIPSVI